MKIIVLAGGLSTERDVSLISSAGICKTLVERGHEAFLLDSFFGLPDAPENLEDVFALPEHGLEIVKNIGTSDPDLAAIRASRPGDSKSFFGPNVLSLCQLADITFLGLHGGEGENGKVQATFDLLGIRYTGPDSFGCALAMDKSITKYIFQQCGVETPRGVYLRKQDAPKLPEELGLSLPVVVKTCCGGSSVGVYIPQTREEYLEALDKAFAYEQEVVIEEYIKGREFSCGFVDDQVFPPVEIIPKSGFFDYTNKYQDGATEEICPANISPEVSARMQDITARARDALKLQVYSRADFLMDENENLYCLEVNTLPGMTPASLLPKEAAAVGISYGELCELIIQKSLEARYHKS
jgi:D-alanine-D-alanine ligase